MSELCCHKMSEDGAVFVTTKRKFDEDTQQAKYRLSVTVSLDAVMDGEAEREVCKLGGDISFTRAYLMYIRERADERADEIQMLAQRNFRDIMEKLSDEKE